MGKCYRADFTFLGHRNYVHGTSMTHGLIDALDKWGIHEICNIAGAYHKVLKKNGNYHLFDTQEKKTESNKNFVSTFIVDTTQDKYFVGLEDNGEDIIGSIPYDEESLINTYNIEKSNKSVCLSCNSPFHLINIAIALTKRLHLTVLPTEGFGQWYWAGYDLRWPMTNAESPNSMTITVSSVFNNVYTKNIVNVNGSTLGNILFAREIVKW